MSNSLPFALRVVTWPLRVFAQIGLWLMGALLAVSALAVFVGGDWIGAFVLGVLAGLCFELRCWVA